MLYYWDHDNFGCRADCVGYQGVGRLVAGHANFKGMTEKFNKIKEKYDDPR
jgi:hypothetical protein